MKRLLEDTSLRNTSPPSKKKLQDNVTDMTDLEQMIQFENQIQQNYSQGNFFYFLKNFSKVNNETGASNSSHNSFEIQNVDLLYKNVTYKRKNQGRLKNKILYFFIFSFN